MRISGPSRTGLDEVGDEFAGMVDSVIDRAVTAASRSITAHSTQDDLGVVRRTVQVAVDSTLLPYLEKQYWQAAGLVRDNLLTALTAALEPVPPPAEQLAAQYLETASNRLKGVSDEVWEHTRSELVAGMQAGESVPQLRKRVMSAAGVSKPRANVIARTEVIGAQNRGSLEQMKAAGYPATKTWLATNDSRTRETHRNVNGVTVDLEEKFTVGGAAMDGPHDPFGPPGETISCRCTLIYEVAEEDLTVPNTDQYRTATMGDISDWDIPALTHLDDTTKDIRKFGRGDHALEDMWRQQGFDLAPDIGTAEQLDAEVALGGLEAFRGYQGAEGAKWAQQFLNGSTSYGGKGIYGNGTYFSYKPGGMAQFEARLYAGKEGVLQRVVLRASAKTITFDDLIAMMKAEPNLPPVLQDPGRYATARGYDAILGEQENHLNVLNRTALIVEEP